MNEQRTNPQTLIKLNSRLAKLPQLKHGVVDYFVSWLFYGCCCDLDTVFYVLSRSALSLPNSTPPFTPIFLVLLVLLGRDWSVLWRFMWYFGKFVYWYYYFLAGNLVQCFSMSPTTNNYLRTQGKRSISNQLSYDSSRSTITIM